ncbi:unnamed protein product [Adineta ricciae]|uniref:J domain-containing protein n=1 Tax=Adineta ricciae TaxID=249248 RepID=A0A815STM2_ADIRI|nr:unnamed protein product [Adineta ricciae]CAF1496071.1 unnamed protein product [Adineta ricciae]
MSIDEENESDDLQTRLLNIDENDFYELLDVCPNATQTEIRNAYKKRALEWHPDRNVNSSVNTTKLFQALRRAYETLSSETGKKEYDDTTDASRDNDDEDDVTLFGASDTSTLHMGRKISDTFREQIDEYIATYQNVIIVDNYSDKINEILQKFQNTMKSNIEVDRYIYCNTCHQTSLDKYRHHKQNVQSYATFFANTKSILLEEVIDPSIWHWQSIKTTTMYLSLWNDYQQWNSVKQMIEKIEQPVEIIRQSLKNQYWSRYIEKYQNEKQILSALPEKLSYISPVNVLPDSNDTEQLKSIFDEYNRDEEPDVFTKFKLTSNDQRTTTENKYCLVAPSTKHKYIDVNDFYFPIQDPPSRRNDVSHCRECEIQFTFFLRRHTCRMCSEQYCAKCLSFQRIPQFGYIAKPVRICVQCSIRKELLIYETLLTHTKRLIETNKIEYLSNYLALVYRYQTAGNEAFYRQTGDQYYSLKRYSLAVQCFIYAGISDDEWFQYAQELCAMTEYTYAFTCLNQCQHSEQFWLNQASQTNDVALIVLCYARIKLTIEQFFEIVTKTDPTYIDKCIFFLLYMDYVYKDHSLDWKNLGSNFLLDRTSSPKSGDLLMFVFVLHGQITLDDWIRIAEQLSTTEQFDKLAYLLSYLYDQRIVLSASADPYIFNFTKILRTLSTSPLMLDDWLNEVCLYKEIRAITTALSFIHVYQYTLWGTYKQKYINDKQYYKVMMCHKMVEQLSSSMNRNDISWFMNGIEDENSMVFELCNGVQRPDWIELGNRYFNEERYTIALNCYLTCEKEQIDQIILEQAQKSSPELLLYYVVVYKRLSAKNSKMLSKDKTSVCNDTFYNICKFLSTQGNEHVKELIVSAMKSYDPAATHNMAENPYLFKFHLLLLNEIQKMNADRQYDDLINGGVHTLMSLENKAAESTKTLIAMQKPLLEKINSEVYNELKAATYKSCQEMIDILLDSNNYFPEQLENVYHQCLGRLKLDELQPLEYRAKMYLIRAMIYKLANKPIESSQMIHQALLTHPYEDLIHSIITFVNHSHFHSTLQAALIDGLAQNSFSLADINPPTLSMNLTFLRSTDRLRTVRRYERAILKRLADKDPLQAAMSYIDLNMATDGDSTSYTSNLILACLYLYKAMTLPNKSMAEIYAYRSVLCDILVQLFVLARSYLPLYAQMHLYTISLTLLLRSNELFKSHFTKSTLVLPKPQSTDELIIGNCYETLIEEIMKNIVQISKVTPFTHVPISTTYDMIYLNYAGDEFLSTYLKQMTSKNSMYQYYFFEGIWKGWIRDEEFEEERIQCMYALLDERHFNMNDVENLLNWLLLPRTVDGWLWSGKHRLQLSESSYSRVAGIILNSDTGDIDFLFKEATNTEHHLFDMNDVVDILTNGIVHAAFTLDPPSLDYHSHPFNEMKYIPRRLSSSSNYLSTLLHADYLLKMFSTATEICGQSPFEMRSADVALMSRLPAHIRDKFKAILEQKNQGLHGDVIHRYWIQAGIVSIKETFHRGFFGLGRTNENILKIYIADDLKMSVRKHRMRYDERGNLIDDKDDLENDQSPEAEFARTFTKYYDDIGEYFPELLRLKELLKLGALSLFLQERYAQMNAFISAVENDTKLNEALTGIRHELGQYPTYNQKIDDEIVATLSNRLCKEFFCRKNDLKSYIIHYLTYGNQRELIKFLKQSLIQHKTKLKTTMDKLKIYIQSDHLEDHDNDKEGFSNDPSQCAWVPAVFSNREMSRIRVYGGVNNILDIRKVENIDPMKSIKTVNAQKSFEKSIQKRSQSNNNNQQRMGNYVYYLKRELVSTGPGGPRTADGGKDGGRNGKGKDMSSIKQASTNQFQKAIEAGKLPKIFDRVDKGNPNHGEKDHVHFKNKGALNKDGTWKHKPKVEDISKIFTAEVKKLLLKHGWTLPEGVDPP